MSLTVAEYLGQRTDIDTPVIQPNTSRTVMCPFAAIKCSKASRGNQPVCSIRKSNGTLWIVCEHRLCATQKTFLGKPVEVNEHQKDILHKICKHTTSEVVELNDIFFRREVPIPVIEGQDYKADYVVHVKGNVQTEGPKRFVLEMQGGGETSNTQNITTTVKEWAAKPSRTNADLRKPSNANTIENNAWKRQQEQFLIKGNVAVQTGGGIVFCVGTLLYDYLHARVEKANLNNLKDYYWTLALISIREDTSAQKKAGPIPLEIDPDRQLFTNYHAFLQVLTNQGDAMPTLFYGEFNKLSDGSIAKVTP